MMTACVFSQVTNKTRTMSVFKPLPQNTDSTAIKIENHLKMTLLVKSLGSIHHCHV